MARLNLKKALAAHQQGVTKLQVAKQKQERKKNSGVSPKIADARKQQQEKDMTKFQPLSGCDIAICLGEGDFSYANAIIQTEIVPFVIATSLDKRDQVCAKYSSASDILEGLESDERAKVLYGVDATSMDKNKQLKRAINAAKDATDRPKPHITFVFNFPHCGQSESNQDRLVRQHQELMLGTFKAARALCPQAKFALTLFDGEPYNSWETKRLARVSNYEVERTSKLAWEVYPGYKHQLTAKGDGRTSRDQRERGAKTTLFRPVAEAGTTAGTTGTTNQMRNTL